MSTRINTTTALAAYVVLDADLGYGDPEISVDTLHGGEHAASISLRGDETLPDLDGLLQSHGYRRTGAWEDAPFGVTCAVEPLAEEGVEGPAWQAIYREAGAPGYEDATKDPGWVLERDGEWEADLENMEGLLGYSDVVMAALEQVEDATGLHHAFPVGYTVAPAEGHHVEGDATVANRYAFTDAWDVIPVHDRQTWR